jgi:hypothetical protein
MAFQTVIGKNTEKTENVKLGELTLNHSVEGYLVGLASSKFKNQDGTDRHNIVMQNKQEQTFYVYTTGSARDIAKYIQSGLLTSGLYTKITYTGDKLTRKDGTKLMKPFRMFEIAQDPQDVLGVTSTPAAKTAPAAAPSLAAQLNGMTPEQKVAYMQNLSRSNAAAKS